MPFTEAGQVRTLTGFFVFGVPPLSANPFASRLVRYRLDSVSHKSNIT